MPKLMKGATPNELVKRCDGRSDVNHWIKSTRASETITQKHSDAYRSSWGHDYKGKLSMEINFKCIMPKLKKGATPNELVKRCDGRSDVNHWMKSTRASETITQKHSDAYRSSWGVTITTRLALKQSLSTTSIANLHNCL
ncbi:hypothetical protein T09_5793 [Trichinella sp. T9]|nr:hypothetical protein T09_5793 [Trichinella sp. T9]